MACNRRWDSELVGVPSIIEFCPYVPLISPYSLIINTGMSKAQREFLVKLGVRVDPPLASVMAFMTEESEKDEAERHEKVYAKALNYLTQHLGPGGLYERDFSRSVMHILLWGSSTVHVPAECTSSFNQFNGTIVASFKSSQPS